LLQSWNTVAAFVERSVVWEYYVVSIRVRYEISCCDRNSHLLQTHVVYRNVTTELKCM